MPKTYPNILLIAGTGRKVGKTALACAILQQVTPFHEVVAVKVTPRKHPDPEGMVLLHQSDGWSLYRQVDVFSRDSSRMLAAGAFIVYLVQGPAEKLPGAFREIMRRHDPHTWFLFESGGLRQFIEPGIFLVVTDTRFPAKTIPEALYADALLDENVGFKTFARRISLPGKGWKLSQT